VRSVRFIGVQRIEIEQDAVACDPEIDARCTRAEENRAGPLPAIPDEAGACGANAAETIRRRLNRLRRCWKGSMSATMNENAMMSGNATRAE